MREREKELHYESLWILAMGNYLLGPSRKEASRCCSCFTLLDLVGYIVGLFCRSGIEIIFLKDRK